MTERIKCPHEHGPPLTVVHAKAYERRQEIMATVCDRCGLQVIELLRAIGRGEGRGGEPAS